jgi:hypothetical protein
MTVWLGDGQEWPGYLDRTALTQDEKEDALSLE